MVFLISQAEPSCISSAMGDANFQLFQDAPLTCASICGLLALASKGAIDLAPQPS